MRTVVILVVLAGGVLVWQAVHDHGWFRPDRSIALWSHPGGGEIGFDGSVVGEGGWPTPSAEAGDGPLGVPSSLPAGTGPYRFAQQQDGDSRPVAYDPCRPLHLVTNDRTAPPQGASLVRQAGAELSRVTGLQLVDDGSTEEEPSIEREVYQPDRYGDRWAPVLVAWSDPVETPELEGDVSGLGGSGWVPVPSTTAKVYVSGLVTLDGPQFEEILERPNGRDEARAVILHELGHLVGLDHVEDPTQLMNAVGSEDVTGYAAGDLMGLAELGRGGCFPSI